MRVEVKEGAMTVEENVQCQYTCESKHELTTEQLLSIMFTVTSSTAILLSFTSTPWYFTCSAFYTKG